MNSLIPWFHIFLAVLAYLLVALSTMLIVKKWGSDLKNTVERTSTPVLLIGALANLVILVIVLILMTTLDHFPITALGLGLSPQDGLFTLIAIASMILLAGLFVRRQRAGLNQTNSEQTSSKSAELRTMLTGFFVLLTVAVQEEILYRGYITLNLAAYGPLTITFASTVIFVLIHFLTNRIGKYQLISWTISGLLLSGVYLISGSIWVPIALHLVTDLINVLFFDITDQQTAQDTSPAITDKDRATFRIIYGLVVFWILFAFYFPVGQRSFSVQMNSANPKLVSPQNVDSNLISGKVNISGVEVGPAYIRLKGQSTLPNETCILVTLSEDGQPVPWWPTNKCAESTNGQWEYFVELGKAGYPENLDDTQAYTAQAQANVNPPIKSQPFVFDLVGPPAP